MELKVYVVLVAAILWAGLCPCHAVCNLNSEMHTIRINTNVSDLSFSASERDGLPTLAILECLVFKFEVANQTACTANNSWLLLEYFAMNSDGRVADPLATIGGIFFGAAFDKVPYFAFTGDKIYFGPLGSRLDYDAATNMNPVHRVAMPVSEILNATRAQALYGVLTNINTVSSDWSLAELSYGLRATCMPKAELPCPRPSPTLGACGQDPAVPSKTRGSCSFDSIIQQPVCSCDDGWDGESCNTPIINLASSNGDWNFFDIPPRTWRYFEVTIPYDNAYFVVEMLKPAHSLPHYQPVLMVGQRSKNASGNEDFRLPGYANIEDRYFVISDDCICLGSTFSCDCHIPYQAVNLDYFAAHLTKPTDSYSWYIGVFNNAPVSAALPAAHASEAEMVGVRSRYTVGSAGSPICPMDCSNQGDCRSTPAASVLVASFQCVCYPNYGGPICEGPISNALVSTSKYFESQGTTVRPGEWMFFSVEVDVSGLKHLDTPLSFQIASPHGDTVPVPLITIFSPLWPRESMGDMYFAPFSSTVFNSSNLYTFNSIYAAGLLSTWVVGVYNPNIVASAPVDFALVVSMPAFKGLHQTLTLLQLGLIGALAATMACLVLYIMVRMTLMRRNTLRNRAWGEENGASGGQAHGNRVANNAGVPPEIIATFPLVPYSSETAKGGEAANVRGEAAKTRGEADAHGGSPNKGQEVRAHTGHTNAAREAAGLGAEPVTASMLELRANGEGAVAPMSARKVRSDSIGLKGEASQRLEIAAAAAAGAGTDAAPVASETGAGAVRTAPLLAGSEGIEMSTIVAANVAGTAAATAAGSAAAAATPAAATVSGAGSENGSPETPLCSICLIEYEDGDMMRQLPCNHLFHKTCIDVWMTRRSTCPVCRYLLVPEASAEDPGASIEGITTGAQAAAEAAQGPQALHTATSSGSPALRTALPLQTGDWTHMYNNPLTRLSPGSERTSLGVVPQAAELAPALAGVNGASATAVHADARRTRDDVVVDAAPFPNTAGGVISSVSSSSLQGHTPLPPSPANLRLVAEASVPPIA